jgi:hypothetical protein
VPVLYKMTDVFMTGFLFGLGLLVAVLVPVVILYNIGKH